MSHFTKIKTKLVKEEFLVQALKDLGHQPKTGNVKIKGYQGQMTDVDVMIPTKNAGYDIGFVKNGNEYELVADWYGIKDINADKFVDSLSQRYSYNAVVSNMEEKGFDVVEEETEDNIIHMTVRRSVF